MTHALPDRPLSVRRILAAIEAGETTPRRVLAEAGERIDAADDRIKAFVARAPAETLAAAAEATGPLAGVPFGAKDIFDSFDMTTEHGSPIYRGHGTVADAALVAMARARGSAIVGKTATTQFASLDPAPTCNPHDLGHTPGGSSSGSAAAVASGMLAAACGSQTGGSVIRPASFCGIAGYKPSFRLLPTVGMKTFSWSLDTAGLFAASVDDVALFAAHLTGRRLASEPLADASGLTIGLYRSCVDDRLEPDMVSALGQAAAAMEAAGARLVEIEEPVSLAAGRDAQSAVQNFEAAQALFFERTAHRDEIAPLVLGLLDEGAAITPDEYDNARRTARIARKAATTLFESADALLTPSALGAAPHGLASTGDPVMNKLWTLTGNPVVNVPGLKAANGLPLGLSIVTRFGRDAEALAIAALLERLLARP